MHHHFADLVTCYTAARYGIQWLRKFQSILSKAALRFRIRIKLEDRSQIRIRINLMLDLDPHKFADSKPKCMENEPT
jgi:hypothetical protein